MNRLAVIAGVILLLAIAGVSIYTMNQKSAENPDSTATASSQPTNSATVLLSDKNTELTSEDVEYFPGAKGLFVRPKAEGNYPGVVMIHENRGLRPEIKTTAQELAKEGYMVLAVDLYKGQVADSQEQARSMSGSFNQEEGVANMKAAAAYLRKAGATKIASWGWCFGGRQSVALAISGEPLDATVVYYGGNMATKVEELKPIKWPVLGVFGDQDQAIPMEKVKEFETSLNSLGIENEIHIYPGVGHAFANPSGANYAPEPTKDAWGKTLDFLNRNLKQD
jgi:carboxymethylenebutenolidase